MRGLFHGQKTKTIFQIAENDGKTRRKWSPQAYKKVFFSDILERRIEVKVSDLALKEIKRLGSFDNYILLTAPKDMVSMFGEYLRELMLRKLNNPKLDI